MLQVPALLDHLVKRQRILRGEAEHHLGLQAGEDAGLLDDLPQLGREAVIDVAVLILIFRPGHGAQRWMRCRYRLPSRMMRTSTLAVHQPPDRVGQAFIAFVRAAQHRLRDGVLDVLVDPVPGKASSRL